MVLPVKEDSNGFLFYKNLNEDVKLKSDDYGRWDIDFDFENDDWYNVNGFESVFNACVIAIMTRFEELGYMTLYQGFGCRVHELIKANKSKKVRYNIELFVTNVLEDMRRIKKVNWVVVTDCDDIEPYTYKISFNVSCRIDSDYTVSDVTDNIIQGSFLV